MVEKSWLWWEQGYIKETTDGSKDFLTWKKQFTMSIWHWCHRNALESCWCQNKYLNLRFFYIFFTIWKQTARRMGQEKCPKTPRPFLSIIWSIFITWIWHENSRMIRLIEMVQNEIKWHESNISPPRFVLPILSKPLPILSQPPTVLLMEDITLWG